jgi:hypothetical protein
VSKAGAVARRPQASSRRSKAPLFLAAAGGFVALLVASIVVVYFRAREADPPIADSVRANARNDRTTAPAGKEARPAGNRADADDDG